MMKDNKLKVTGSADADWAEDLIDRKLYGGYLFSLSKGNISWSSKKQHTVAMSSSDTEYQALAAATKEALWLRSLLDELGYKQAQVTVIQQDNKSTIALARNLIQHERTKHIDVAHHFIRDCIERKVIDLAYCSTDDMLADIMMKPLPVGKFRSCREGIGIM